MRYISNIVDRGYFQTTAGKICKENKATLQERNDFNHVNAKHKEYDTNGKKAENRGNFDNISHHMKFQRTIFSIILIVIQCN